MNQIPTIGRIVIYKPSESFIEQFGPVSLGLSQLDIHDELPAIIVHVHHNGTVNLNVFMDGWTPMTVRYTAQGDEPGQWNWPVIKREDGAVLK